jgi:hypothetical protein
MGIFDKKSEVSREEFRKYLKRPADYIPKGGRAYRYGPLERLRIEKEVFGPKQEKTAASREDYTKALRKLSVQRFRVSDEKARDEITKKIQLLRKLGGVRR